MKYPVGTAFTPVGCKYGKIMTVVDYEITRNMAGEIVKARYVTEHKFLGQTVITRDVVETTISRGIAQGIDRA